MYLTDIGYGLNSAGPGKDTVAGFCDTIKKTSGFERNRVPLNFYQLGIKFSGKVNFVS
jgi:hypothetical protein